MSALTRSRQNALLLVILLAGQLFLATRSARGSGGAARLEGWLLTASRPVVAGARAVAGGLDGAFGWAVDVLEARRRNVQLADEVRRLTGELRQHREANLENERLRRLLGMRQTLVPDSIAATVVTANLGRQTKTIVVDRGESDGVRRDQPVVTWGGVVGRVIVVDSRYAKVRLITDDGSGVAGVVQRSRAEGNVVGRAGGTLLMQYVPRFSDVMHGDRVVTSGLDGIFPRGFGIGRVSSIHESVDGRLSIDLEPELDYASLEEVLIVLDDPPPGGVLAGPESRGAGARRP